MKNVILIGDSIRMGYCKYVKEALDGAAEVYYPAENCRFSTHTFRFLGDWHRDGNWPPDVDIVHWNVGLWDALEMDGEGPLNTIETYEMNIGRIYRKIKRMYPNAVQVFATSTNVVEEGYKGSFRRSNTSIERYNEIAVKFLKEQGVYINDLYSLTKNIPSEYRSDMTHFNTPQGTKLIGDRVISVICELINIDAAQVKTEDFVLEKFSDKSLGF